MKTTAPCSPLRLIAPLALLAGLLVAPPVPAETQRMQALERLLAELPELDGGNGGVVPTANLTYQLEPSRRSPADQALPPDPSLPWQVVADAIAPALVDLAGLPANQGLILTTVAIGSA